MSLINITVTNGSQIIPPEREEAAVWVAEDRYQGATDFGYRPLELLFVSLLKCAFRRS